MHTQKVTLGEFERRYGVNKGTVSKKARELGYETSEGLTPEAYEHWKAALRVKAATDKAIAPLSSPKLSPRSSPLKTAFWTI